MEKKLLDLVKYPADLRKLKKEDLKQFAKELREELIDVVSVTGGHLGAGLGVVELTIALHYVFDTPKDKLVWDVSHQSYPHKIITGRKDRIKTLLLDQLISPVLWHQSIHYLNSNLGVKSFMEVGPKNVLTGLIKRIVPDCQTLNFGEKADLEKI